ncbi:MAG TPA: hypothetical protein VK421_17910 [Pyrinomonadaceae bacterium]|nr:hypothetical protein [Pyrinomonadaceae bacterium]
MTDTARVRRIRVGDDIQSYCGRCKAERAHLVAAMKSDTVPAQVICRTCQNRHNFRAPAGADGGPRRARPAPGTTARRPSAAWTPGDAPPRPYSAAETYAAGAFVEHPRYGVGRVEDARGTKIDVRFDDGVRTLIHAG